MKRVELSLPGIVAVLIAVFPSNLSGGQISVGVRLSLLVLGGLVILAGLLSSAAGERIRMRLVSHRNRYAALAGSLAFLATGALVLLSYIFFISLGTWNHWPPTTDYYDRLAQAFLGGQLYVKEAPDPALLALPNPYDPEVRKGIPGLASEVPGSIWDMALYRNRVYLYWGPAPALLVLVVKAVIPAILGDQLLTFAFLFGSFVFASLILIRLWQRFFADTPCWSVIAGMLLLGLANPVPWLLFSPRIYEAAIAAGQFFLMSGLYLVLSALGRKSVSCWRLALGALAWVGAAGSRATLAVCVSFLAIMVLVWLLSTKGGPQRLKAALPAAAAFGLPLIIGAALLAWYNFARFGSPFEFGFRYEITMLDQNKYHDVLFSSSYLGPNAYLYLLNPPSLGTHFPFVKPIWNGDYVTNFNSEFHTIYNAERIVGLIYIAPFLLFGFIVPICLLASRVRWEHSTIVTDAGTAPAPENSDLVWILIMLSGLGLVQLLTVFLVFYSTMRYFMDAAPTCLIVSMLGFWIGYRRVVSNRARKAIYIVVAVTLMLFTIVMGVLIGFSSDVPRLRATNPALLVHLRLFFHALARRLGL